MSKLIIDNQSTMPDDEALRYVITVIRMGIVIEEGQSHCPVTTFTDGVTVMVASDRFIVRGKA